MSATRRRAASVGCSVGQDHVTLALALASLAIGLGAMVTEVWALGAGLRQPVTLLATSEPTQQA